MNLFKRIKAWWEDRKDPFGKYSHDKYWLKRNFFHYRRGEKGHYCWDWDGQYICDLCSEFNHCNCCSENNIILSEN